MFITSNSRIHCGLVALILFILIFLSLPLFLIYLANTNYEKCHLNPVQTLPNSKGSASGSGVGQQQPLAASASSANGTVSTAAAAAAGGSGSPVGIASGSSGYEGENCLADHEQFMAPPSNCNQYAFQADLSLSDENFHCPIGTFPCLNCPDICIEQWRNCDGHADCPDRSDENSCHDDNGVIGIIFQSIVNIQNKSSTSPTPTSNAYAKPESCSLDQFVAEQCPCVYTDPRVIICENLGLSSVPSTLLSSVYKIRMSNNSINSIDHVLWPRSLSSLVLVNNRITHIGRSTFETAPQLSKLYLSHNEISYIDSEAFSGLTSLTSLQIEDNKLRTFDSRMLKSTPMITKIYLSENMIDLPDETKFGDCQNLKELFLDYNRISVIRSHWFSNMTSLMWLSLMHNDINYIEDGSFDWNYELEELNLSFNKIKFINRQTFARHLNIQRLYLGGNPLKPLPVDAFKELVELRSLNLTHVQFDYITNGTFSYLTKLEFIYFAKFRYCHYANHVRVCRPSTDGLSSVRDLLAFPILKYAVWIVASVCSLGNVFVFIWRSISPHEDCTLSLFVRNLSIADLMMGIYLGVIGWQDWKYQHRFGRYAIDWMSSWTCTTIGFLAILSSELSVFILTIITIERYRSIISIETFEKEAQRRQARFYVAIAWILSFLIACYPLVEWLLKNSDYYATNGLCLPLHIDQPYTPGWLYSAFIYLGINFSAVMVIIILYVKMYSIIMKVQKASKPAVLLKAEKREDAILAIRFFFIVVTDCLCWIPIVVIKIMALANVSISSSIYGWLVVFIIPINSALNPIVYTLAAPTSLRAAVVRLFERICYKVDDMLASGNAVGGGGGSGGDGGGSGSKVVGSHFSQSSGSSSSSSSSSSHSRQLAAIAGRRRNKTGSNPTSCDTIDTSISSQHSRSTDCAEANSEIAAIIHANNRPSSYHSAVIHQPRAAATTTGTLTTMASHLQANNGKLTSYNGNTSIIDSPSPLAANRLSDPRNTARVGGDGDPLQEADGKNFYRRYHVINSVVGADAMAKDNGNNSYECLSTYESDSMIGTSRHKLINDDHLKPPKSARDGERLVAIVVPAANNNNNNNSINNNGRNKGTLRHMVMAYDPLERRTSIETNMANRNHVDNACNNLEKNVAGSGGIARRAVGGGSRRYTQPSCVAEEFGVISEHIGEVMVQMSQIQDSKPTQVVERSYIFPSVATEDSTSDSLIDLKTQQQQQQQMTMSPRQSRVSFSSKDSRTCLLSQTDSC